MDTSRPNTPTPPPEEPVDSGSALADKAKDTYQWWDNLATLNENDPVPVMLGKIGIRVVGIIVLIAMSPLILLGFLMAFIVVA